MGFFDRVSCFFRRDSPLAKDSPTACIKPNLPANVPDSKQPKEKEQEQPKVLAEETGVAKPKERAEARESFQRKSAVRDTGNKDGEGAPTRQDAARSSDPRASGASAASQVARESSSQAAATGQPRPSKGPHHLREEFFDDVGEATRYSIREVIGKGSYGVVCSAVDNFTGEMVAIKKITDVFQHVSDATRILREIKLLRLLKHPDIVDIKHIMLPPNPRDYKDIYVVFELMETDLHQVIKANDDLTPEHHQFFLYQMLRGLKYIHSAKVFHRDIKPKNILANSDCKLKICDFGLARPAFTDSPTTIFWTDYVATRWYRAPELCGSFFAKYSPSIDLWSVGCIFAEILMGKPLFPGKNVVHQLELITDLLGTPSDEVIHKVRNEKARRFLVGMKRKPGVPFELQFPQADRRALSLLRRLLSFDPSDRPSTEEALADPYFQGLHNPNKEPAAQPISRLLFEFDRRKVTIEEVRDLIYVEICQYHPKALEDLFTTEGGKISSFNNPSALDNFKRQFMHLEANPGSVLSSDKGGEKRQMPPKSSSANASQVDSNQASTASKPLGNGHACSSNAVVPVPLPLGDATASQATHKEAANKSVKALSRYLTSQVSAPTLRPNADLSSRSYMMNAAAEAAVAENDAYMRAHRAP